MKPAEPTPCPEPTPSTREVVIPPAGDAEVPEEMPATPDTRRIHPRRPLPPVPRKSGLRG